ncbi:hypothetical protein [Streptomyces sp. S186]|uniref:hypothetical protein n=1 Tax=Streptomyces sp. S186 TaxID=3434395 RepID=UPI003F66E72F
MFTLGDGRLLPDGPAVSLRELGSGDEPSHVQKMDADRYLRGIQDRVTGGVQQALHKAGWQTTEERTVNVGNGGVFIDTVHGAVGVGEHNTVPHNDGAGAPAVDPSQEEELLRAVRELREDLARAVPSPVIEALNAELADTEGEITGSGAAGPGRLARLRAALVGG